MKRKTQAANSLFIFIFTIIAILGTVTSAA